MAISFRKLDTGAPIRRTESGAYLRVRTDSVSLRARNAIDRIGGLVAVEVRATYLPRGSVVRLAPHLYRVTCYRTVFLYMEKGSALYHVRDMVAAPWAAMRGTPAYPEAP